MNKAIMLSIRPKYCELIANGKKTIEVRKTKPKIAPPFKCYIYCTKPNRKHQTICGCMVLNDDELYLHPTQGIKHGDSIELMCRDDYTKDNFLNGKVIGEFVCDKIDTYDDEAINAFTSEDYAQWNDMDIYRACIHPEDLQDYANGKWLYGWHISDLLLYDKPMVLWVFSFMYKDAIKNCNNIIRAGQPETVIKNGGWIQGSFGCLKSGIPEWCKNCLTKPLTRPPQSWCYVEELRT